MKFISGSVRHSITMNHSGVCIESIEIVNYILSAPQGNSNLKFG